MIETVKKGIFGVFWAVVFAACLWYAAHEKRNAPEQMLVPITETVEAEVGDEEAEAFQAAEDFFAGRAYREAPADSNFGAFLAGAFSKTHKDFAKAAAFYEEAFIKDPSNPELIEQVYILYALAGNFPKALQYSKPAFDQGKNTLFPSLIFFVDEIQKKEYAAAQKHLTAFKAEGYVVYLTALLNAWTAAAMGDGEGAAKFLEFEKGREDTLPITYTFHRALIYALLGENEKAMEGFNDLLNYPQEVKNAQTVFMVKGFYERIKQPLPDAFQQLVEVIKNESFTTRDLLDGDMNDAVINTPEQGMALAFFDISSLLSRLDNSDTALFMAQMASVLNPNDPLLNFFKGEVLENMGCFEGSISSYEKIKKGMALYYSMLLRVAVNYDRLGETDKGIDVLQKELKLSPVFPLYYMTIGDLYRSKGDFPKALDAYKKALSLFANKLDPATAPLYFYQGVCYEEMGDYEGAMVTFKIAVSMQPKNPIYLNYLGYTLLEQGKNTDEAVRLIEAAVKDMPNDGSILDSLGWAYVKTGHFDKAVEILEKAADMEPGNAVINDHLGDAYWKAGRHRDAQFQWAHALSLKQYNTDELKKQIREKIQNGLTE